MNNFIPVIFKVCESPGAGPPKLNPKPSLALAAFTTRPVILLAVFLELRLDEEVVALQLLKEPVKQQ